MLLDEIDEMADMVKKTYSAMEQIYAMYLPFFPVESARIDMLHQLINAMNEDQASAPRHAETYSEGQLIPTGPVIDLKAEVLEAIQETSTVAEESKLKDAEYIRDTSAQFCRMLFRKINQLCHPDKCRRFSYMETKRLRDCFDDANDAYSSRDAEMLELVFIRVCYIRDELHRLSEGVESRLASQHRNLQLELDGIRMHPLYMVLAHHNQGMGHDAKQCFGRFLGGHIQKLEVMCGAQ